MDASPLRTRVLVLLLAFAATLPVVNPLVHGDGVGYYAYLRAPIIQHNLRFEEDWRHANPSFVHARIGPDNEFRDDNYTSTGRVGNLFTIGPAILWTPFFLLAHASVLIANGFGANIPANGFSLPYRLLVALGTAIYGFLGLLLSYLLSSKYLDSTWAYLATIGIWASSSLPVYMYFNPFWSHSHSAFIVALFLWYWDRTRPGRTLGQLLLFGIISGMVANIYFVNGVFLLIPLVEAIQDYIQHIRSSNRAAALRQFGFDTVYLSTFLMTILPTLITRKIIFGGMLHFGSYTAMAWDWRAPFWRSVLFSSDHGMVSWTPILGLALLGIFIPFEPAKRIQAYLVLSTLAFFYVISSDPFWNGTASFGNRFFISLTSVFVFGLATMLQRLASTFRSFKSAHMVQALGVSVFAAWNLAFIFQWGIHLVPARGKISWRSMIRNQFVEVPNLITQNVQTYFTHRSKMMEKIERDDVEQQGIQPEFGK